MVGLARRGMDFHDDMVCIDEYPSRLLATSLCGVALAIFRSASTRGQWSGEAEQTAFYKLFGRFLDADRPDTVLTFGGDPATDTLIRLAKNRDIPVAFALHNFSYGDPAAFAAVGERGGRVRY